MYLCKCGSKTLIQACARCHMWQHICSYLLMLTNLGLMHLSSRRIRSDLVETLKITSDMYGISKEEFLPARCYASAGLRQ